MAKKTDKNKAVQEEPVKELVPMVRDDKTADVHPDEVDNYAAGGWVKK